MNPNDNDDDNDNDLNEDTKRHYKIAINSCTGKSCATLLKELDEAEDARSLYELALEAIAELELARGGRF